jgi:hypothetical protein
MAAPEGPELQPLAHGVEHVVLRQGLLDEPEGAEPSGFERRRRRAVGGDDHDGQRFVQTAEAAQHLESVDAWHLDVEKDQIRLVAFDGRQSLGPGAGDEALIAVVLQDHPHGVADGGFVIHDENPTLHGRMSMTTVAMRYSRRAGS